MPAEPHRFQTEGRFTRGLNHLLVKLRVDDVPHIKRIVVTVVGGTVLIIGAALIFLPGPGMLVILGGMAILGTEYAWARRWLRKGRMMAKQALSRTQKIIGAGNSAGEKSTRKDKAAKAATTAAGQHPADAAEMAGATSASPADKQAVPR